MKKLNTGYSKKKKKKIKKPKYFISLFITSPKKVSFKERIIKFFIYIALRLVVRPSKWKNPEKNYEIINRSYARIMSSDFVYIPSSLAFYFIISFMPIMSLVLFFYQINFIHSWIVQNDNDALKNLLSKFIPGIGSLIEQIKHIVEKKGFKEIKLGAFVATILSLIISSWISASGFTKLVFTQSYIYEHKYLGGFWTNRIKGMLIVFSFTIFIFLILMINIFLERKIELLDIKSHPKEILSRFILIIGLFFWLFIGFTCLYKFSPRFKISFKNVIPGALVSTMPTALFLSIFGSISSLWSYGQYGILGTIMYIGMLCLIITYFIFVGIITNAAHYKTFINKKVKNKWTISKK